MTSSIEASQTLPLIGHLYDHTGAFKQSFALLNTPDLTFAINGQGASALTVELGAPLSGGAKGDILKLTEDGGDGSVLYAGVVEDFPEARGAEVRYEVLINPIGVQLGDTPFATNYTTPTDLGQMARDAVDATASLTWDATSIPLTGVSRAFDFSGQSYTVQSVLDELRLMAGVDHYYFPDASGKVWFVAAEVAGPADYKVMVAPQTSVRTYKAPVESRKNIVIGKGGIPSGDTSPIEATYDNSAGSPLGKRVLTPFLTYPDLTDVTTLQSIVNTVGSITDREHVTVAFDLVGFGERIVPGKMVQYFEEAVNEQPEGGTGPAAGALSPLYVVLSARAAGPVQSIVASDIPTTVEDLRYLIDAMIERSAQTVVDAIAAGDPGVITPPMIGSDVPSTPAAPTLSTAVERIAQADNASITCSWLASPGTDYIATYRVRWREGTGDYHYIDSAAALAVIVHNLTPGVSYGFSVAGVNTIGNQSAWSTEATQVAALDVTAPATPTGLAATQTPRGAIVTWDANTEADLQGYKLQVSIDGAAYVDVLPGPTHSTLISYVAPAGTPAGTSLQFKVQAVDWSGNASAFSAASTATDTDAIQTDDIATGAVTANEILAGTITANEIAADTITGNEIAADAITADNIAADAIEAQHISAGAITADKLAATLILASLIKAGSGPQHVEMDSAGLRAYDAGGHVIFNIPSDGTDATINANVVAKSLSVVGDAILQGIKNELALGAKLVLDASQGDPGQAPIVVGAWDGVSLPVDSTYDTSASTYQRTGLDYDAAGDAGGATKVFWTATKKNNGSHEYLLELLASDRTVNRSVDLGVGGSLGVRPLSVARLGSYIYTLLRTGSVGGSTNLGNTGGATNGPNFSGVNLDNQIADNATFVVPAGGIYVNSISIKMGGHGAAVNTRFCIWNSAGTLLVQSATFSAASGTALRTKAITQTFIPGGTTIRIGFWRDAGGSAEWSVVSGSGTFLYKTNTSGSPGSMSGASTCAPAYICGRLQAYLNYSVDTSAWKVQRYSQSTLALDTEYTAVDFPITPSNPVMCSDGTNLYIVDKATGGTIKWNVYDGALVKQGSTIDTTYTPGSSDYVSAAAAGSADFGAFRMALATLAGIETFDSTGARQTNELFPWASTGARTTGIAYGDALGDGARFWSLPGLDSATGAVNLTKHSTWIWTTASSTYWIGFTWYDSAGTTHETLISPRASIVLGRRQQLVITALAIPGTGGADEPNNIRFYALPNATDPGAGGLKLQATQTGATYTATGYDSGGAADPGSNNFPSGGSAEIRSQATGWIWKGDGTWSHPFRARAHRVGLQSVTTTELRLQYNTIDYDPNGDFDVTTNIGRYTCPKDGYYRVSAAYRVTSQSEMILDVLKSGTAYARIFLSGTAGAFVAHGSTSVKCVAGDYLECWAAQPGGAQNFPAGSAMESYFEIEYTGNDS